MFGLKVFSVLATAALGTVLSLTGLNSGPDKGDTLTAFEPTHVTGADAGTQTCPVCKYGNLPAVQVWVNEIPNADVEKIAANLEKRMAELNQKQLKLKSFMLFKGEGQQLEKELTQMAKANRIEKVALAWVPPTSDALQEYRINPKAKTTVLVYKNRQVAAKFVDLKAENLKELNSAIDRVTK